MHSGLRSRLALSSADFSWLGLFAVLVVVTRLHSLVYEIIDWDESTFVIMASSILRGYLPYVHLWDNKPPVVFFLVALVMKVFGESLVTLRLTGDFFVFLTAVAVYFICRRSVDRLAAGAACCALISVMGVQHFQPLLTEHVAIALVMLSIWLVLLGGRNLAVITVVGVLMALATLTRMNLAYVVIALGAYFASAYFWREQLVHRFAALAYAAGGLLPLLAFVALYWSAGALDIFFVSVFTVPLSYATEQQSLFQSLFDNLRSWVWLTRANRLAYSIYTVLVIGALGFACAYLYGIAKRLSTERTLTASANEFLFVSFMAAATFLSVLASGAVYPHYWIQLFPFAAIFMAHAMSAARTFPMRAANLALAGLFVVIAVAQYAPGSVSVARAWGQLEKFHGLRLLAAKIAPELGPDDQIYVTSEHLLYWYLRRDPPSPMVAHPNNIVRPAIMEPLVKFGYVKADEFERLLATRPRFIINSLRNVFPNRPEGPRLAAVLKEEYELWMVDGRREVYRLRNLSTSSGSTVVPTTPLQK